MSSADSYRKTAAQLRAKALKAPSDEAAAELDNLGRCYIRLARQAEQNRLAQERAANCLLDLRAMRTNEHAQAALLKGA